LMGFLFLLQRTPCLGLGCILYRPQKIPGYVMTTRSIIHILSSPMDILDASGTHQLTHHHYKLQDFKMINLIHMIFILNFIFIIMLYAMR
jgi:hypothetical protein